MLSNGSVLTIKLWHSGRIPIDIVVLLDGTPVLLQSAGGCLLVSLGMMLCAASGNLLASIPQDVWATQPLGCAIASGLFWMGGSVLPTFFTNEASLVKSIVFAGIGGLYLFFSIRLMQRSWMALIFALSLFVIDAIGWLWHGATVTIGGSMSFAAIFLVRFFVLVMMALGFGALSEPNWPLAGVYFIVFRFARRIQRFGAISFGA